MARNVPVDITAIIDTDLSEENIETYITSANVSVSNILSGSSLSPELLKEIERWFTAHLIAISKERISTEEVGGPAKIKYAGVWGSGLNSTPFGQQVIALDTTGAMASVDKQVVKFKAVKEFD